MKVFIILLATPLALLGAVFGLVTGCTHSQKNQKKGEVGVSNPVSAVWEGPYQGVPAFDKIQVSHFKSALDQAMANILQTVDHVANQKEAPTFENTILPLETATEKNGGPFVLFGIWASGLSSPEVQALEKEMAPKLADFSNKINLNPQLFRRIDQIYKGMKVSEASTSQTDSTRNTLGDSISGKEGSSSQPSGPTFSAEQKRLVWKYHSEGLRAGAALSEEARKKVAALNKRHAELTTQFVQNTLADEDDKYLLVKDVSQMKGMSEAFLTAAFEAAKAKGVKGYLVKNTRSTMQPFLTYCTNRELRRKAFEIWTGRGDGGDKTDNNALITEIVDIRRERSQLLGFSSYAHWKLADKMAKTPENAMKLMLKVWEPAKRQVKMDVAAMTKIARKETGKKSFQIQAWDYRFYAEKLRQKKYDFDMDRLKPYLEVNQIRKAMFWMADQLYGLEFEKVAGLPVFHKDVTVYQVKRGGEIVGLWYFDPFAREGKRSGAWMNAYRVQHRYSGREVIPIVSNNSNFIKAPDGQRTTISWDDASTMFHEFGHALHGLNSDVTYPSLAGTATARDFVEFPSQIHEDWLSTDKVMKFLTNEKGEPLPRNLITKLKKAASFNEGFATVEYLASALVDMKLHLSNETSIDPKAFERQTLEALGMPSEVVMRHRLPHFGHLFSGEGYSAGYYSYLWSDVLRHDAFKAFNEGKGPYDKEVAQRFMKTILSVGNTVDPAVAYEKFRGRGPDVKALLNAKGFKIQ